MPKTREEFQELECETHQRVLNEVRWLRDEVIAIKVKVGLIGIVSGSIFGILGSIVGGLVIHALK